jgi:hypothetical protein
MHHYCLVRADMPLGDQFAQLLHAAGRSVQYQLGEDDNTHAVALTATNEEALLRLSYQLDHESPRPIPHVLVREPDPPYNGQVTALGICPQIRDKRLRKLLAKFPLIR